MITRSTPVGPPFESKISHRLANLYPQKGIKILIILPWSFFISIVTVYLNTFALNDDNEILKKRSDEWPCCDSLLQNCDFLLSCQIFDRQIVCKNITSYNLPGCSLFFIRPKRWQRIKPWSMIINLKMSYYTLMWKLSQAKNKFLKSSLICTYHV